LVSDYPKYVINILDEFKLSNECRLSEVRFEIFRAMKVQAAVFRIVTPCSDVVEYQVFGGPRCLHLHGTHDVSAVLITQKTTT
jgi:hypothetical protein